MRSVRSPRPAAGWRAPGISSPAGGWKWIPFGAGSSTSAPDCANAVGATPCARANARENAARDPYPAASATCDAVAPPVRSCHAERSSSSRRRRATGDSPVAAASSRSRWSREKCARSASARPSAPGSSSESSTMSISSRRRSLIAHMVALDRFRPLAGPRRAGRAPWCPCPAGTNSRPPPPPWPPRCVGGSTPTRTRPWPPAPRRRPAHLRQRGAVHRRRAVDRIDVGGAQGAGPAARPALRAAQRLGRAHRLGGRREGGRRRRGDHRPRARASRSTATRHPGRRTCFAWTCARRPPSSVADSRDHLVIDVWTAERRHQDDQARMSGRLETVVAELDVRAHGPRAGDRLRPRRSGRAGVRPAGRGRLHRHRPVAEDGRRGAKAQRRPRARGHGGVPGGLAGGRRARRSPLRSDLRRARWPVPPRAPAGRHSGRAVAGARRRRCGRSSTRLGDTGVPASLARVRVRG